MDRINDPIYGVINVTTIESQIINSTLFQRLRNIKQLGLSYYVYPTATHNRFSHSIGVMHLASRIFTMLQNKYRNKFKDCLNDIALKNLRMAGLLHDLGHFPFSHSLEFSKNDILQINSPIFFYNNHEEFTEYLIKESYIKEILNKDDDYDIDSICGLITRKSTTNLILNNLIHWELDADRLDYLLRDSYFTGVNFGIVDYNYLINNFEIIEEEDPLLVINNKAGRAIENILNARYSLYDRVYTHKIISYYDYLLKNLVLSNFDKLIPQFFKNEEEFKHIILDKDSNQFIEFTDTFILKKLHDLLKNLKSKENLCLDLENTKLDLESLLLRRKNDEIFRFPYVTKKQEIDLIGRFIEIDKLLKKLDPKYPSGESDIRLNRPTNKFTTYKKENYSIWNISPSGLEAIKEKEKGTILIINELGEKSSFFQWNGSYFKDIYENNNFKSDIYIRKKNQEMIQNFKNDVKNKIFEILKD